MSGSNNTKFANTQQAKQIQGDSLARGAKLVYLQIFKQFVNQKRMKN